MDLDLVREHVKRRMMSAIKLRERGGGWDGQLPSLHVLLRQDQPWRDVTAVEVSGIREEHWAFGPGPTLQAVARGIAFHRTLGSSNVAPQSYLGHLLIGEAWQVTGTGSAAEDKYTDALASERNLRIHPRRTSLRFAVAKLADGEWLTLTQHEDTPGVLEEDSLPASVESNVHIGLHAIVAAIMAPAEVPLSLPTG